MRVLITLRAPTMMRRRGVLSCPTWCKTPHWCRLGRHERPKLSSMSSNIPDSKNILLRNITASFWRQRAGLQKHDLWPHRHEALASFPDGRPNDVRNAGLPHSEGDQCGSTSSSGWQALTECSPRMAFRTTLHHRWYP